MKKVQLRRITAMIAAICILTMAVGNSILVFAEETEEKNEGLAIMADNITINAGNKEIDGMAAEKQDIYNMSSAIIATLPEEAVIGEQYYTAQSWYAIEGGIYFDKSVMFATTDVVVSDTLVSKGNIEVYVDTFTSAEATMLFSKEGNIIVNATKVDLDGLLYAPGGNITINAGNVDITGTIIANDVTINASDVKITADEELINYINYICSMVSDDYIDLRGVLFDTEYTFSVVADKEIEYADVYIRVDSENDFHKFTTVYNPTEEATIELAYDTTIDITVIGYTAYGEKVDAEIETYGKDEYGSLYYKQDTDEDGLSDGMEIWYLESNPYTKDTDGDGFDDYYEVMVLNTDPTVVTEDGDYDEDDVTNKSEITNGTNPYLADTDFDGLSDSADSEPIKYNSGYEASKIDYKVIMTAFDAKKIYTDEDGNVYAYIINKLTGQEKALLSSKKNTIIYYDAEGRKASVLREINGIYKINTYEYNESDKVIGISNNGYRYDITYSEAEIIEKVKLNGTVLIDYEDIENKFTSKYNEEEQLLSVTNDEIGYKLSYEYVDGSVARMTINDEFVIEYNDTEEKYATTYTFCNDVMNYEITGDDEGNIYSKLISSADLKVINGENIKSVNIKEAEATITNTIQYNEELVDKIIYNDGKTISYEYDKNGYISNIKANDTLTNEYIYDGFGQLVKDVDYKSGKTTEYSYNYDNITDVKVYEWGTLVEHKEYKYDEVYTDKLISVGSDKVTYDANGNIINFKGVEYEYDNGNLSKIVKEGITSEYIYNENGYRVQKNVNGIATDYYYENERLIAEKGEDYTIWYVYADSDEKVGFIYKGVTYYYERNAMGDIVNILDPNGNVVVTYSYDSWGNVTLITGDENIADVNPIRYRGYYYDKETGLHYLNTRYYNSEIGRFMSLDEAVAIINSSDNYNLYVYCCNNPVNYYDPDGREKVNVRIFVDKNIYNLKDNLYRSTMDYYEDAKKYVQNDSGIVSLNTIASPETFFIYWKNMSWNSINVLAIFAHGTPDTISFGDGNLASTDVYQKLSEIHLDLLVLSGCNVGHYDSYLSDKSNNIAYAFSNRINNSINGSSNTSMVLASDGTVYPYNNKFEGDYKYLVSVPDATWLSFSDNLRKYNYGWILFINGKKEEWDELKKTGNEKIGYLVNGINYECEAIDFDSTIVQLKNEYSLKWTLKSYK